MKMFSIKNRYTEMEQLIVAERPRLLQYACYRLGSIADAEDAVQDTLVSLHQRMQEEDFTVSNLSAYLYRSLSNRCVSYQRENNRLHLVPLDCQTNPVDTKSEDFEQEYQRISQLLAEIPDEQAEVIRLRYYGDKTFKEIAQILDEPVTTVKSRFVYGLEKIKRGMQLDENRRLVHRYPTHNRHGLCSRTHLFSLKHSEIKRNLKRFRTEDAYGFT